MWQAKFCPACGSSDFTRTEAGFIQPFVAYRTGATPHLGRTCVCPCGLIFCSTRFHQYEIEMLYADYRGESYNRDREIFEPGYISNFAYLSDERDYWPTVEEFITAHVEIPATVLDIGGHDGVNTPFRRNGANITIAEVGQPISGSFDLVVMAHVLEHVSDPRRMRRKAFNVGRFIYAEVPIEANNDHWHEHVQKFNESSLRSLFKGKVIDYRELDTTTGRVAMVLAGEL